MNPYDNRAARVSLLNNFEGPRIPTFRTSQSVGQQSVWSSFFQKRLLSRGKTSGRSDDNLESIRKRFRTYEAETRPIIQRFAAKGKERRVNADRSVDDVWADVKDIFEKIMVVADYTLRRLIIDALLLADGGNISSSVFVLTMSKTTMTPEEQLEDLQRRFQLLEGERKATYETAQLNIKQNKEIIKQMKEENRSLRTQIAQLRTEVPKSVEKQLEGKMSELNVAKNKLDAFLDANSKKEKLVAELADKVREMSADAVKPTSDNSPQMRQVRVLENRLDKTLVKFNEAQSIKRTYEQILKRLEEERMNFDNQLQAVERTLKSKEHDYEELLLLSHDAYHAKEMAQAELHRFEQGVMEERNQRDKEVHEKKALVQQRVEMNHRLEQRERMLRQQQDLDKSGEMALRTTGAMAHVAAGITHGKAEEERQRMNDYEDAFRRIKEATGVSDVNEVIQKFLNQEDTLTNLLNLTNDYQERINSLIHDYSTLKGRVDELKFSASGGAGRRQVADDLEARLTEAADKAERNKAKYERLAKMVVDVNAGVFHLAGKLESVDLDGEPQLDAVDAPIEEVLSQVELKLSKLISSTGWDTGANKRVVPASEAASFEDRLLDKIADMQSGLVRVRATEGQLQQQEQDDMANDDGEDEDDGSFDEKRASGQPTGGVDEDVWNRKHVKYNSQQIIEKQLKKERKKAAAVAAGAGASASPGQNSSTCANVAMQSLKECERCLSDDQCSVFTNATHTIPLVCSHVSKKCVLSHTQRCPGDDAAHCLMGCEDQLPPYACATASNCLNEDYPCNWVPGCTPPDQMSLSMSACLRGCPDHSGLLSIVYVNFEGTGSCDSAKSWYGCTRPQEGELSVPVAEFCPETCGDTFGECSSRCRREEAAGKDGLGCWDRVHGAAQLSCQQAVASGHDCHCTCYEEYFRKFSGGPFELGRDAGLYRNLTVELSEVFDVELTGVGLAGGGGSRLKLVERTGDCKGQQIRGVAGLHWEQMVVDGLQGLSDEDHDSFYPLGDTPPAAQAEFWHRWDGVSVSQCGEFKLCHCNIDCDEEEAAVWREVGLVTVRLPEGASAVALSSNALVAESCFPAGPTTTATPFDMWAILTTTARPDTPERARVTAELTIYGRLEAVGPQNILAAVKDVVVEGLEISDPATVSVEERQARQLQGLTTTTAGPAPSATSATTAATTGSTARTTSSATSAPSTSSSPSTAMVMATSTPSPTAMTSTPASMAITTRTTAMATTRTTAMRSSTESSSITLLSPVATTTTTSSSSQTVATTTSVSTARPLLFDSGLCEDQDAYLVQESELTLGGALLDTCVATVQLIGVPAACDDPLMGELMQRACRVTCDSCEGGSRAPVVGTTRPPDAGLEGTLPAGAFLAVVAIDTFYQSRRLAATRWLSAIRIDTAVARQFLTDFRRTLVAVHGVDVPDTLWVNVTRGPTAAALDGNVDPGSREDDDGGGSGAVVAVVVAVVGVLLLAGGGGYIIKRRRRLSRRYENGEKGQSSGGWMEVIRRWLPRGIYSRYNEVAPVVQPSSTEVPLYVGARVRLMGLRRLEYNGLDGVVHSGPISTAEGPPRWTVLVTVHGSEGEVVTKELSLKEMNLVLLDRRAPTDSQRSYRKRSSDGGVGVVGGSRPPLSFCTSHGTISFTAALLAEALPRGRVEMFEVPSESGPVGHGCEFRSSKLHGRNECLQLLKLLDVPDSDIIPGHIENSSRWLIGKTLNSLTQIPKFVDSIRYAPECVLEPLWRKGPLGRDESIQAFISRRFSRSASRRFADVFAASQCGAPAEEVSLRSCVPHAHTTECWRRSVLWGPFLDTLRPSTAAPSGDRKLDLPVDVGEFLQRSIATGGRVWTVAGGNSRLEEDLKRFIEGNPSISRQGGQQPLSPSDFATLCGPESQAVVAVMSPKEVLPLVGPSLPGLTKAAVEALSAENEVDVLDLYWREEDVLRKPFKGNAGVWTGVNNGDECGIFGFSFASEIFSRVHHPDYGTKVTAYARKGCAREELQGHALKILGISQQPEYSEMSHNAWPSFPLGYSQGLLEFNRLRVATLPNLCVAGRGWYVGEGLGKIIGDLSSGVLGRLVKRLEVSGFVERESQIDWANRSGHALLGTSVASYDVRVG
ncbi:hypothetical protein FOZ61_007833 [Perkinsus olseni]|uniref:ODAD1 central coiled coil region domain-containing protein n=1 Tax=Perkinsus olseni TaxID=32597 RepID=A0A7J6L770_PEROL|nr:hypothetical protein FOZ61_007833 [Perkinsus olseni]